jgi:hypothetical protein
MLYCYKLHVLGALQPLRFERGETARFNSSRALRRNMICPVFTAGGRFFIPALTSGKLKLSDFPAEGGEVREKKPIINLKSNILRLV